MGISESKHTLCDPLSHLESKFVRQSDIDKLQLCPTVTEMKEYVSNACSQKDLQISLLQKENDRLKSKLSEKQHLLEKEMSKQHSTQSGTPQGVSSLSIRQYVEEVDRECYEEIPEVEKEIYRRTMHTLLSSLEKTFKNVSFEMMGHNISMCITPKIPNIMHSTRTIKIKQT